jgi:cobalt-zinc-cadmium efflux system outer membrane protein
MFNAAWARQPEAQSLEVRRDAAAARRQSADSWTAEPPSLELSSKSDQLNKNQGIREYTAGIAIPLWLPGERARTGVLADAELRATDSRAQAAKLRTAAVVRETYWLWQRARTEHDQAQVRLVNAQKLAADVAKRVKAGDLARADQHQADGAAASAEAALAEANGTLATAIQRLRALTGAMPAERDSGETQIMEPMPAAVSLPVDHPAATSLRDRADVAKRSAELARVQTRANPALTLSTTRERGALGESYQQALMVGIRIPFGSDSRNRAKVGTAHAEALEAESQLTIERERLAAELDASKVRVDSAKTQQAAAEKRSQLARESRGFFEKSFRLGETDLPTRLRVELEASEAERQAALARIELAAAVSALRQNLGLLPE